jgi:hypothetical protein
MPRSPISTSPSDAMRPDRCDADRTLRPERWHRLLWWIAIAVLGACSCLGCSPVAAYGGTASLQVSGVAGDQLAFQTVTFTGCRGSLWRRSRGDTTIEDDPAERFTIVAIGDRCSFYADPMWSTIQPSPGHLCSLAFPDGNHTLHVTDYSFSFPRAAYQGSSVVIHVNGDDVATGRHAAYQFSGSATPQAEESWRCNETKQGDQEQADAGTAPDTLSRASSARQR